MSRIRRIRGTYETRTSRALMRSWESFSPFCDRAVCTIAVTDHGEGLMDHVEQELGVLLYRETLQVR
jgi:hypothetical protein